MPPDQQSVVVQKERKWVRVIYGLPLLLGVFGAQKTMGVVVGQLSPTLMASVKSGTIVLGNGEVAPLVRTFFNIKGLDTFLSILVTFFTPILGDFDPMAKLQAVAFGADLVPFQVVWYIEGIRRGNAYTVAHLLPTVLGILYQAKGLGFIAPIYFFLHYIQSPLENYQPAENRLTNMRAVKTIIPTIVLTFLLPTIVMMAAPQLEGRQWVNGLFWQLFPLYGAICQRALGLLVNDTTEVDRISSPEADMPYLRLAYGLSAGFAACANLYVRFASPFPLMDIFFKDIANPSAPATLMQGAARFLRYDHIIALGAGTIWVMLSLGDLKSAGRLQAGWAKIIGAFGAIALVGGPGSAMVAMWAWREEILAKRKPVPVGKIE
ncbi:Uncharacterized protein BP5553_07375 [Venustampulla echinocandica]|uniref:Uncharacterized protein n=1 Tax=Venustampulla echinocandica TaxID=2656787 RepID=A0A370TJA5_9HELO|nr:Uncharacterized protein BP5553_07375 [Venustampulla echinocandica]RDL35444.1 Uncharacterized protein BP5553_07375 [Venustampulla echinocandica]